MTENKAIEALQFDLEIGGEIHSQVLRDATDVAIQALEEVQQYRKIGTVDECREAMDKQTSKSPDYEGDGYSNGQLVYDTWICPCCGHHYEVDYDDYEYCPKCGQHIDWRNENEEIN